ncbi:nucleotide pyrophosphohydrolase [Arsenicicoccus dermatophilus]|uniref:nucleotide pyrophosphohydrolase n=1 Tax=Arsenicicoccus dermatophilus TaxID=1076331 RepID=UPI0039170CEF
MDSRPTLDDLAARAAAFTAARDWTQFHDPKSLILALTGEVGELAELFQWAPASGESVSRVRAGEEMADVLIYLLHLSNALGIDLGAAVVAKMDDNDARFVVDAVSGTAPLKS